MADTHQITVILANASDDEAGKILEALMIGAADLGVFAHGKVNKVDAQGNLQEPFIIGGGNAKMIEQMCKG